MKQLTCVKPRTLKWWDVPEPKLESPDEALVRPFVAARCDGDSVFLRHDFEKLLRVGAALHAIDPGFGNAREDPFHGPFAYGHECVAEVFAIGENVRNHDSAPIRFVAGRS
jgi:alcohol dehydrogenase